MLTGNKSYKAIKYQEKCHTIQKYNYFIKNPIGMVIDIDKNMQKGNFYIIQKYMKKAIQIPCTHIYKK
jgi:hypothetical protein